LLTILLREFSFCTVSSVYGLLRLYYILLLFFVVCLCSVACLVLHLASFRFLSFCCCIFILYVIDYVLELFFDRVICVSNILLLLLDGCKRRLCFVFGCCDILCSVDLRSKRVQLLLLNTSEIFFNQSGLNVNELQFSSSPTMFIYFICVSVFSEWVYYG